MPRFNVLFGIDFYLDKCYCFGVMQLTTQIESLLRRWVKEFFDSKLLCSNQRVQVDVDTLVSIGVEHNNRLISFASTLDSNQSELILQHSTHQCIVYRFFERLFDSHLEELGISQNPSPNPQP